MYKVLICHHNTLNFIDGVGNMKIYYPMKNHFPVGIAKVKFDLSRGGVSIFFLHFIDLPKERCNYDQ